MGRDGRVIDLRVPTGREGGRRGGRGRESVGVHPRWGAPMVLRGEDARGKTAVVLGRRRRGRASAGPVALSGGIGAVRRRRGGVGRCELAAGGW